MALKQPGQIADEAEAAALLTVLLASLALHGVALDMCEHYTALDAYRLLFDVILPEAQIHPQLCSTGFIQHYATWEYCAACAAEFEADCERHHEEG
ncbi:MAG: hypothetical protein A2W31_17035 [Planctomycetes bacterium RBG_16_64_10]|nr:MAG: hypothetical protein A2W31_17035 [Planctomycetes bacterium RBG_16_64_10]